MRKGDYVYSYDIKKISEFLLSKFDIDIDEKKVGEESFLMYKDEIDKALVSKALLGISPNSLYVYTCVYDNREDEWLVCVASDANTNQPLFLLCLKNGLKVYEEILIGGNDSGNDSKGTF